MTFTEVHELGCDLQLTQSLSTALSVQDSIPTRKTTRYLWITLLQMSTVLLNTSVDECCTMGQPGPTLLPGCLHAGSVPVLVGDEGDGVGLAVGPHVAVLPSDDDGLVVGPSVGQLSRFLSGDGVAGLKTAKKSSGVSLERFHPPEFVSVDSDVFVLVAQDLGVPAALGGG
jgi:hypothetical protein